MEDASEIMRSARNIGEAGHVDFSEAFSSNSFCVMLFPMGNKDKGRKETKKAPKPKPKPEPGRKREVLAPAPPK